MNEPLAFFWGGEVLAFYIYIPGPQVIRVDSWEFRFNGRRIS
jgi:hypothetical protein